MKEVATNFCVFVIVTIIYSLYPLYGQDIQWKKRNESLSHEQITSFLQKIDEVPCCDKNGHVHSMLTFRQTDTVNSRMADNLSGLFTIQRIVIKKDNYILYKSKIRRRKIYLIDVQSDTIPLSHLCVISANRSLNGRRIRKGDTINTALLACFPYENFKQIDGTRTLPSLHQSCWIIIDMIFIDNLPFKYRNFMIFNTYDSDNNN